MDNFLDHEIKGVPIGHFPEIAPGTKIIWRSPLDFFEKNRINLITLGQGNTEGEIVIGFCSWSQDHRFKPEVKGTWSCHEITLNGRQIHALQRMDLGCLKVGSHRLRVQ